MGIIFSSFSKYFTIKTGYETNEQTIKPDEHKPLYLKPLTVEEGLRMSLNEAFKPQPKKLIIEDVII